MSNKPYAHVLFCGGETMLCCTVENGSNRVINCRKPAGTRVMPGMSGAFAGASGEAAVQKRSVERGAPADEEAPIPSSLTPDVARELLKDRNAK